MNDFGIRQSRTGYRVGYHENQPNRCPGCGQDQWLKGRTTAECAFCSTALPLIAGAASGTGTFRCAGTPGSRTPLAA